ncbi:bactofilin family protein [Shewanella sp. GXUN23E]|uniref:bactofilin family protein n=1 Tax=Shewanella sp. GXUN23E TaxID=3422498 RepID=UPI003D7CBBF6
MFGKKKSQAGLTYIAQGTKISGESVFCGDALVGGEIHGTVSSESTITIEPDGLITGEVNCQEIKVSGYFKGKLQCEKLTITGSGTVEGEVASSQMEIFEGGQFIGVRVKERTELLDSKHLVDEKKLQQIMQLDEAQA